MALERGCGSRKQSTRATCADLSIKKGEQVKRRLDISRRGFLKGLTTVAAAQGALSANGAANRGGPLSQKATPAHPKTAEEVKKAYLDRIYSQVLRVS